MHGARFAIIEFVVGVFLPGVLGSLSLIRGRSFLQLVFGVYLVLLAFNYLPLLLFSINVRSRERAEIELSDLLNDRSALVRLSKRSLLLLIPILPALSALLQYLAVRKKGESKI